MAPAEPAKGAPAPLPLHKSFCASAIAACVAEVTTIPLDTAKVRLQLQVTAPGATPVYKGIIGTGMKIAKEEGANSLFKGLGPGLQRQCLFGGLRIGLYEPVKTLYVGEGHVGDVPLHLKIAAALTTGAIAMTIASPTDLVKVRMQAEGRLPEGTPKRYPSAMKAYGIIRAEEGIKGLWTGLGPNVARNATMNAAELASYDTVKSFLLRSGMPDEVPCHLISGLGAGLIAVCIASPLDVVKSRMMADKEGIYKSMPGCFAKTLSADGPLAFYKGFTANFARVGSWSVVMFLTLEQVKKRLFSA